MSFLRTDRGIVRGKRFATRKKAGEYVYRLGFGKLIDGDKPTDFDQRTVTAPRAHDPRHVENSIAVLAKHEQGRCRRVYKHGLLWRVTVENIWKSDHATMEDALSGVNAIGVEMGERQHGVVVVVPE